MTDAWNGVPLHPERDGWHWLHERYSWARPEPVLWCSMPQVWRGRGLASAAKQQEVRYIGPCLTPAEVAAREAAARREGIEAAAEIAKQFAIHQGDAYDIVAAIRTKLLTEGAL